MGPDGYQRAHNQHDAAELGSQALQRPLHHGPAPVHGGLDPVHHLPAAKPELRALRGDIRRGAIAEGWPYIRDVAFAVGWDSAGFGSNSGHRAQSSL